MGKIILGIKTEKRKNVPVWLDRVCMLVILAIALLFIFAAVVSRADDWSGELTRTQTLEINTDTLTGSDINCYSGTTIDSFSFYPDRNEIEVVYRTVSPWRYPEGGGPPDEIEKVIYGVVDGKIVKLKTIEGKHVPRRIIEEHIEWPEE